MEQPVGFESEIQAPTYLPPGQSQEGTHPELLSGGFDSYSNDPVAGMAMKYGAQMVGNQFSDVHGRLNTYFAFLKYYFDVDTKYVSKKLGIILVPFTQRSWKRLRVEDETTGGLAFASARDDVNAPDLYIPLMGFVTLILLVGFSTGLFSNNFHPEVLGTTASSALMCVLLEAVILKLCFFLISNDYVPPFLDILSYSGYIFVSVVLNLCVGIVASSSIYHITTIVSSLMVGIFLARSLRSVLLGGDSGNKRGQIFLMCIVFAQVLLAWFLGSLADWSNSDHEMFRPEEMMDRDLVEMISPLIEEAEMIRFIVFWTRLVSMASLIGYSRSQLPRQTPWHNWEEWNDVKKRVFGSVEEQKEAISWIKLWSVRGNSPAAAESTAAFLELFHTLYSEASASLSNNMIRHLISMALIRFVNGIVDQAQRAQFAISMSFLAQKLDLSQSLIDTRHSATHADLPSLNTLTHEMQNAFHWLKVYYWDQQASKQADATQNLREALQQYRKMITSLLRQGKSKPIEQGESIQNIMEQCTSMNMIQDSIIPLFLESGYLVPSEDLLQSSVMTNWLIYHFEENYAQTGKKEHLPLHTIFLPPAPLVSMWKMVLDEFIANWPHFYMVLLQSMMRSLTSKVLEQRKEKIASVNVPLSTGSILLTGSEVRHLILCSWITLLVTENSPVDAKGKKKSKKTEKKDDSKAIHVIQPNFNVLWRQSMVSHTKWGRYLSRFFSARSKNSLQPATLTELSVLNVQIENLLQDHTNIQNGFWHPKNIEEANSSAVSDLALLEQLEGVLNCRPVDGNAWKLCEEWESGCAIGTLPSGFPDLTLPSSFDIFEQSNYLEPVTELDQDSDIEMEGQEEIESESCDEEPPNKKQKILLDSLNSKQVKRLQQQTKSLLIQ